MVTYCLRLNIPQVFALILLFNISTLDFLVVVIVAVLEFKVEKENLPKAVVVRFVLCFLMKSLMMR
jgi:hypothetical protein